MCNSVWLWCTITSKTKINGFLFLFFQAEQRSLWCKHYGFSKVHFSPQNLHMHCATYDVLHFDKKYEMWLFSPFFQPFEGLGLVWSVCNGEWSSFVWITRDLIYIFTRHSAQDFSVLVTHGTDFDHDFSISGCANVFRTVYSNMFHLPAPSVSVYYGEKSYVSLGIFYVEWLILY